MGEIADSMIYGDACEMCGTPFEDEGSGFPRYCSEECAKDRGAKWNSPKKKVKRPPQNLISLKMTFDGRPLFRGRPGIKLTGFSFEQASELAEKIQLLVEEYADPDEEDEV